MLIESRPTSVKIKLKNLVNNLNIVKKLINKNTEILAVVKADAYGHGAYEVSKILIENGVKYLGVASSKEAKEIFSKIKHSNFSILSFGKIYKEDISLAKKNKNYHISLSSFDSFNYFDKNLQINVHINIDTGMGRCGIFFDNISELFEKLKLYPNINVVGVYSHFPAADEDKYFTIKQIKQFREIKRAFNEKGFKNVKFHISNSDGIVNFPQANFDLVRPGIMLYGSYWNLKKKKELGLKPVMEFYSRIVDIKYFKKGMSIGYKRKFIVGKNNYKLGLVPVGYADGYSRFFSNIGIIGVNGKITKVAGVISMDWIMIDINDLKNVKIGDKVILFGDDNFLIDVDVISAKIGTISYEIFCSIGQRVNKEYEN